ncbi:hypothetical protein OHB49_08145 [Streptomyces sp. NBC_01717]|uniref:hypothetical protein n=1 Tax=Streptomyces sp. NBC_01717 TaxID=2975918 RepID=UPI002E378844|nr:hypothetical protein [Streptomyces sp. NBC_01717]
MSDVPTSSTPCRTCGINWPRTPVYYHLDPLCIGGLKKQCRECANAEARRRYAANPTPARERVRARREELAAYWTAQWADEARYEAA